MKKIFLVLAVMAALIFSVAPSQALNSIDDNVPGVHPFLPFFLVDKAGYDTNTGLDTLMVIQEIGGGATAGKVKGGIHIQVRDKKSVPKGSKFDTYTPDDVQAYSVRDLIEACVGVDKLPDLEAVLNGVTYYTGYIDFYNSLETANNLVAFMYLIDLDNGWAAATTAPVFEHAESTYADAQKVSVSAISPGYGPYVLEPFSANGYAWSEYRSRTANTGSGSASSFRLMPRWFLKDANAETFIPVWSSANHVTSTSHLSFTALIYDNAENVRDLPIDLPYEVNWLDVRGLMVSDWQTKTGGWIDIDFPNTVGVFINLWNDSWLAYSYQTASSSSIGANWSVLHPVHREVGTLTLAN